MLRSIHPCSVSQGVCAHYCANQKIKQLIHNVNGGTNVWLCSYFGDANIQIKSLNTPAIEWFSNVTSSSWCYNVEALWLLSCVYLLVPCGWWAPCVGLPVFWCCCPASRLAVVCAWSWTRGTLSSLLLSPILNGLSYHHPPPLWFGGGIQIQVQRWSWAQSLSKIKAGAAYDGTLTDYQSIHVTQWSTLQQFRCAELQITKKRQQLCS